MALKDTLWAINNELIRLGVLPDSTPLQLGSSPKRLKTVPKSVFWVPNQSKASGPNVSVSKDQQDALSANGGFVPRALRTRLLSLDCHLWGGESASVDEYSSTEFLLDAVVTAMQNILPGGYIYSGEKWINPGTEAAALGHRCIAYFAVNLAVNEVLPPNIPVSVEIETIDQTAEIGPLADGSIVVV